MKTIIVFISFVCCIQPVLAQTYYYDVDKTFQEDGYTYQCDVLEGAKFVTLYNKENKLNHVDQVIKGTNQVVEELYTPFLEEDNWTRSKCRDIVNNSFTAGEKQRLKGREITITMYISSETGRIINVEFQFISTNPFATIPVSVYHKIETELKKSIWFIPNAEGKKVNYIFRGWRQEVK